MAAVLISTLQGPSDFSIVSDAAVTLSSLVWQIVSSPDLVLRGTAVALLLLTVLLVGDATRAVRRTSFAARRIG